MKYLFSITTSVVFSFFACITEATPVQDMLQFSASTPQSPEPAILLLFGAGILGLTGVVRTRSPRYK